MKQDEETYIPVRDLSWGVLANNRLFNRKVVVRFENDLNEIEILAKRGWKIIPGVDEWIFRAPEVSLYDLSEVHMNPTFDPVEIFSFFLSLKKENVKEIVNRVIYSDSEFTNFHFSLLESRTYFESCIRIAGIDNRIKKLPVLILDYLKKHSDWDRNLEYSKKILKDRELCVHQILENECSHKNQIFSDEIMRKYHCLPLSEFPRNRIYTGFWHEIPLFNQYFSIPKTGVLLMRGFLEELGYYDKVNLIECHIPPHISKEVIWTNKSFRAVDDCSIALLDIVYGGQTINMAEKQLINFLTTKNINFKAITKIGLFPKSRSNLSQLDYAVILDKLFKTDQLDLLDNNFFENMFIEIVNS
ncbi:MAG: hypothetical protein AAB881_01735 [Patescibacteria group bacterium]